MLTYYFPEGPSCVHWAEKAMCEWIFGSTDLVKNIYKELICGPEMKH